MNRVSVDLAYGEQQLTFSVPAQAVMLSSREPDCTVDLDQLQAQFTALLPNPLPAGPIAIVVADKTRLCDYPCILPWLVASLQARGGAQEQIRFYIAYGTHGRQTEAESMAAYGPLYQQFPFVHHQSLDQGQFVHLGTTRRGTPVRVRRDLVQSALIITVGAISHHYFAGFGGGRKLLFPGLAEQEAIYRNHQLFLDQATHELASGCRSGQLSHNPLAEDLEDIHRILPPYLSIHGLLNSAGEVVAYRCGNRYHHFVEACVEHDQHFRSPDKGLYPLVLASAGGFPKDINFIQAHKAIDNAAAFVADGGLLIILAQCRDGIGSSTFLPYIDMNDPRIVFAALLHRYCGNGGTALSMMTKNRRISVALITELEDSLCNRIGMTRLDQHQVQQRISRQESMAIIANSSMLVR